MIETKHFILQELVCNHVFKKYGQTAWQFLDPRLLITLNYIRKAINRSMEINTYHQGGTDSQSGLRCNLCHLVYTKTKRDMVYMSAHCEGQAIDFSTKGLSANDVREWLIKHHEELPYSIRLESGDYADSWVHLDVRDAGQKVYVFNP